MLFSFVLNLRFCTGFCDIEKVIFQAIDDVLEKVSAMQERIANVDFSIFEKKHIPDWAKVMEAFNEANSQCTADSQEVTDACFRF